MRRKGLFVLGILMLAFVVFALQSCRSTPEKGLLSAYFHAISLKDSVTMSTMALEPMSIDVASWRIVSVSTEITESATLADLNKKELELKKNLEGHVGPVMEAEDGKYAAEEELKAARTGAAKAAAKKKVEEATAKFEQEREIHRQLQKDYNEAKAAAAREEQVSLFSIGAGQVPNIRELTGTAHSKDVDINVTAKDGQQKVYRFNLKRYELRDEAANMTRRGRWIIVRFEPVG